MKQKQTDQEKILNKIKLLEIKIVLLIGVYKMTPGEIKVIRDMDHLKVEELRQDYAEEIGKLREKIS